MSGGEILWWDDSVLDRKRWGEVVEPVLERLTVARDRDRLPQALLLVGPPGLGRELAAVEASAMLVCDGQPGPWAEGRCADRVRRGAHPDVVAVKTEGKGRIIKIEGLRDQLVQVVGARPYEGLRRVWIIDGAEERHLPKASANTLLKTLEEPPEHAMFILLAANPEAVLPTIRSRCQQLVLPGVVALARKLVAGVELPELAASPLDPADLNQATSDIRKALETGRAGETGPLVRLPYRLPEGLPPFAAVASVALEMACEAGDAVRGEDMIVLAADLLATERRTGALNLNPRSQLASCLMRWFQELSSF